METLKKIIVYVLAHLIVFFRRGKIYMKAFNLVIKRRLSKYPKKTVIGYITGFLACIVLLIVAICFLISFFRKPSGTSSEGNPCPYNFELLKESDENIFAWLEVPGTSVDYPVHMSKTPGKDNGFINSSGNNLSKPNLFIYGACLEDSKEFFSTLLSFQDIDFCVQNRVFTLYAPSKQYIYEIVAVLEYPDTDIENFFDFSTFEGNKTFLDVVEKRRGSDNALLFEETLYSPETPYVTLLTSAPGKTGYNFLVIGKLLEKADY